MKISRREFVLSTGIYALGTLLFGALSACEKPTYYRPKGQRIRIGHPEDFAIFEVPDREHALFVIRDSKGWATMDARCTYSDGCDLSYVKKIFFCPCCGSAFDRDGLLLGGPATKPLDWCAMGFENDFLFVSTGKPVSKDTRFTTPELEARMAPIFKKMSQEGGYSVLDAPYIIRKGNIPQDSVPMFGDFDPNQSQDIYDIRPGQQEKP